MILLLVPAPVLADAEGAISKASGTEPPMVTNITLSGTTIDVPGSVTVTVSCADNDSGVARCQISFRNAESAGGFTDGSILFTLSEGSNGTWSGQIALNENYHPGAYVISFVNVTDNAGNGKSYYGKGWSQYASTPEDDRLPAGLNALTITVTNNTGMDFEAPTLSNLTLSAASITAPGSVAVTVNCADNDSGVASVFVMFENDAQQTNLSCSLQEVSAGIWAGQIPAYESTSPGDYVISNVILRDRSMNSRTYLGEGNAYYASEPANKKLPADLASLKITVTDGSSWPTITTHPMDVTADAGTTATFTVVATGATAYQWQYRKSDSGDWANAPATGNTTATLKVVAATSKNGYQYRCIVSNALGGIGSAAATLRVPSSKPSITMQPLDRLSTPGDIALFWVGADGATAYQWQFRRSASGSWANATAAGNKTASLRVSATAYKNGYEYRCKVSNAIGYVFTDAVKLSVYPVPKISAQPQNTSAVVGATATFSITASNVESYQWEYRKPGPSNWANATAAGNKTATLKVHMTANKDGYCYRCKLTNGGWTEYSDLVTLTVLTKPTIEVQPQNTSALVGATATFTVTATDAASYQWQFCRPGSTAWSNATAAGNKTATLKVPMTANKDGYQYRCKLTNAAGTTISAAATLSILTKPAITLQPQNVTSSVGGTAVFRVTATDAASYQWQYRKTADGSWANATAYGNKTETLQVPVTANKNGYQYRCKITNAAGSVYSSVATLSIMAKPAITSQPTDVTAPVGGTATFSVTATGAESYQWEFLRSPDGMWSNATAAGNKTATLNVPVTAYKNGYRYRCKVVNAVGTVYSSIVTLTVTP